MSIIKQTLGIAAIWLCLINQLRAQDLELTLPDTVALSGATIRIPMVAKNFSQIVSLQLSINWDQDVLAYQSFESVDLENIALGELEAAQGILRLSWFDIEGEGETLPDSSTILLLNFQVLGQIGTSTTLNITNDPLEIQVFRATNVVGDFEEVNVDLSDGAVSVVAPVAVAVETTNVGCFGESSGAIDLTVDGSIDFNVFWSGPDGFTSGSEDLVEIPAGDYIVDITDVDGNPLFNDQITVIEPEAALNIDDIRVIDASCADENGSALVEVSGGSSPYTFDIGQGSSTENVFAALLPGSYMLTVTDENNCTTTAEFQIQSSEIPNVDLGNDITRCASEKVTLIAGEHAAYAWSTGATTAAIDISEPGTYSVTVSNESNCTDSDTVTITFTEELELTVETDFLEVCPGESLELIVNGADEYQWVDTSGTLNQLDVANPLASPTVTTAYSVTGSGTCGLDSLTLEVIVLPVDVSAGPDTCVASGDPIELSASGGIAYEWQPSLYPVSNPASPTPTVNPEESTTYVVAITDLNGCVTLDSVNVLLASDPENILRVNLITPNGDGKNDVLEFNGIEKFGVNTLKIYNRWGGLVYQKVNYMRDEERFDGTQNGNPLPAGNYFYLLSFRTASFQQTLTIIRE